MTTTKKKILSIVSIIAMLLILVSCQSTNPVVPETTTTCTEPVTTPAPILPDGVILAGPEVTTVCTVTYPASNSELKASATALAEHINAVVPNANLAVAASEDSTTEYQIALCEPDSSLASNYTVKLDGKLVKLCGDSKDTLVDAVNYFKVFCIKDGYLVVDEALDYASGNGPEVLSQYPEKYYYYEDVYTPSLAYTFVAAMVDTAKSRLMINGVDVTDKAVWNKNMVTLTDYTVDPGDHTVLLALSNKRGDIKVLETTFSCGDGSDMNLYAGEIHAHTSDSDGKLTVQDAYAYARDVAKLDFFAITDHSGSFKNEVYQGKHIPNAEKFNEPGKFAALYGYEQTYNINTGYFGHLNTINHSSLTGTTLPLNYFYQEMAKDSNAIVMFNHPGYTWGNFMEYDFYTPEIDAVLNLSEIKNIGAANYEYALSLTKGWHVSPVYNEDNHSANWGTANEHCGYVLAPSLTRQNILDAFSKNRTYTTSDCTLKIYYKINGEWMGSRLDNPDNLHFSVQLSTEKNVGLGVISIIAEDGIIVEQIKAGTAKEYTIELDLPPHYDYYYIKVESGNIWAYTAPIWIENRECITVDELYQELIINNNNNNDHRIYAKVTNHTAEVMKDVTVNFYLTSTSGFLTSKISPVQKVTVGEIAPGATVTVYADVSYSISLPRVYADVKCVQNGKNYGAVKYMEFSTIYFTEILPFTSGDGVDAFEFIELYNNSDSILDLSSCSMRYYSKAGANATVLKDNTWNLKGKIQPHSTLVIWMVSAGNTLTVADFNKHFGTNLVEGENIIMLTGANIPHSKPVQIELLTGSTITGRVWYNWGRDTDVHKDKAIIYNYPTDYTMTAKVEKSNIAPTPGTLVEGQVPKTITP